MVERSIAKQSNVRAKARMRSAKQNQDLRSKDCKHAKHGWHKKALDYEVIERPSESEDAFCEAEPRPAMQGLQTCEAWLAQKSARLRSNRTSERKRGCVLRSRTKTCEARIANMRSMIGTSPRFAKQILRSELALDYEVIERPVEDRIYSAKQNQSFYEGLHSCKA